MLKKFVLLVFTLFLSTNAVGSEAKPNKPTVIIITGPSCSGKSTLISQLKKIAQKWHFVAADQLEDEPGITNDSKNLTYDDKLILYQIFKYGGQGFSIVVDTILYEPIEIDEFKKLVQQKGYNIYTVFLHTSLENLANRVKCRKEDCSSEQCEGTTYEKAFKDFASLNSPKRSKNNRSISNASPHLIRNLVTELSDTSQSEELKSQLLPNDGDLEDIFFEPKYEEYDLTITDETKNPVKDILALMGIEIE